MNFTEIKTQAVLYQRKILNRDLKFVDIYIRKALTTSMVKKKKSRVIISPLDLLI